MKSKKWKKILEEMCAQKEMKLLQRNEDFDLGLLLSEDVVKKYTELLFDKLMDSEMPEAEWFIFEWLEEIGCSVYEITGKDKFLEECETLHKYDCVFFYDIAN